jgi:hypothetical protein
MPKSDPKWLKSVEAKLSRLVRCVVAKASDDPEFARQLAAVFEVDGRDATPTEKPTPPKRRHFNPVTFLHEHGEERLRIELGFKTDSELREIIRSEGIMKGKEVNALERDRMINDIIAHSDRRLHQGASFLS